MSPDHRADRPERRSPTNTCAACGRPIGISYLMCAPHWHLVSRDLKAQVFRTWGALQRGKGGAQDQLSLINEYRAARDQAVAVARWHMDQSTGEAHAKTG